MSARTKLLALARASARAPSFLAASSAALPSTSTASSSCGRGVAPSPRPPPFGGAHSRVVVRRGHGADPTFGYDPSRAGTSEYVDKHFGPEPMDVIATRKLRVMTAGYFKDFGGLKKFAGRASTIRCHENNPLVRAALNEPGDGRVLVVDGGGSTRCALMGDNLAALAAKNGWSGVVVNGCVRDVDDVGRCRVGVKAIAAHPVPSSKRDPGLRDVDVSFAGVTVSPGDWIYADSDGVVVSGEELTL
jgi:RraA family protein